MKRKYKFFNGDLAEYETNEEYEALAEKNWELMKKLKLTKSKRNWKMQVPA